MPNAECCVPGACRVPGAWCDVGTCDDMDKTAPTMGRMPAARAALWKRGMP